MMFGENIWLLWVLGLAGIVSAVSAMMGVNPDVAIFYDAGLRHLDGQRLYMDFYVPFGPIPGILFAAFLAVSPTGGLALVLLSAITQMIAAFCVWSLVYSATNSRYHALIGGVFTAFWFQVQMGGFYNDHLSYLFTLVAAVAFVSDLRSPYKEFLVGILLAIPFYSKQTTGLLAPFSLGVAILIAYGWRFLISKQLVKICIGFAGTHALILASIFIFGDFEGFVYYVFKLPMEFAHYAHAGHKQPIRLLTVWLMPYFISPWDMIRGLHLGQVSFYPLVLMVYTAYVTIFLKHRVLRGNERLLYIFAYLLISSMLCSALLGRLYAESTWGLGGVLAIMLWLWRDKISRSLSLVGLAGFVIIGLVQASATRDVFFPDLPDQQYNLWPVQFNASEAGVPASVLAEAVEFMQKTSGAYAVLDSEPYLIPLALGRAPINPPVFYVLGQTVPLDAEERNQWERRYVAALAGARYVISGLDSGLTFRTPDRAAGTENLAVPDVSLIRAFLASEFIRVFAKEGLAIYERTKLRSPSELESPAPILTPSAQ